MDDITTEIKKSRLLKLSTTTIKDNRIIFQMLVPFECLIDNQNGLEGINNFLDCYVEDGYLFQDINYKPVGVKHETDIIIEVNADASEWFDE